MNIDITIVILLLVITVLVSTIITNYITKKNGIKERDNIETIKTSEIVEPEVYKRLQDEISKTKNTDEYR